MTIRQTLLGHSSEGQCGLAGWSAAGWHALLWRDKACHIVSVLVQMHTDGHLSRALGLSSTLTADQAGEGTATWGTSVVHRVGG